MVLSSHLSSPLSESQGAEAIEPETDIRFVEVPAGDRGSVVDQTNSARARFSGSLVRPLAGCSGDHPHFWPTPQPLARSGPESVTEARIRVAAGAALADARVRSSLAAPLVKDEDGWAYVELGTARSNSVAASQASPERVVLASATTAAVPPCSARTRSLGLS